MVDTAIYAAPGLTPLAKLLDKVERMRSAPHLKSQHSVPKDTLEKLPPWPENSRAVPNGYFRSALFGATAKKKHRKYIEGEDLAAIEGVTIRYRGERLDQGDLDVWLCVVHAVRLQDLGSQCRLTSYALLKLMGKTDTGKNRARLQACIERLVATALTVKQGRYSYIGNLISFAAKDDVKKGWVIALNPGLRPLFAADQFTQVDWKVRQWLSGHQLAQWLHGFYASHAKPFPVKIETLHRLCGSEASLMSDFAKTLRKALDAVADASLKAYGEAFFHYDIRGDLVHVEKLATGAQRRHLAKKAATPRKSRA